MKHLKTRIWYIPSNILHPLNGEFVVHLGAMQDWLRQNEPWLSADEAEAFADSLKRAASSIRQEKAMEDTDEP